MAIAQIDDFFSVGLGKDVPAMGPFKNYVPNVKGPKVGPGGIVSGAITIGTHVYKNRKFYTRLFSVATGAGVRGGVNGKTNYPQYKALQTRQSIRSYRRYSSNKDNHKCCRCCREDFSERSRRRRFY